VRKIPSWKCSGIYFICELDHYKNVHEAKEEKERTPCVKVRHQITKLFSQERGIM
jgi:hypothetical protein